MTSSSVRQTRPTSTTEPTRRAVPGFWGDRNGRRDELSLLERIGIATAHGGADIVTAGGLVLSLR